MHKPIDLDTSRLGGEVHTTKGGNAQWAYISNDYVDELMPLLLLLGATILTDDPTYSVVDHPDVTNIYLLFKNCNPSEEEVESYGEVGRWQISLVAIEQLNEIITGE